MDKLASVESRKEVQVVGYHRSIQQRLMIGQGIVARSSRDRDPKSQNRHDAR